MFPNDPDARDIAERAVIRCAAIFGGWGNFEKLAKSFVRKALRSYQRKLARKRRFKQKDDEFWQDAAERFAEPQPRPYEIDLEELLAALPAGDREIVERHYLREESVKQIAESLGKSVRTIQHRIHEAIAALQENAKNF
jgi:RNA polymerase sigma factor (sigma-70 family)